MHRVRHPLQAIHPEFRPRLTVRRPGERTATLGPARGRTPRSIARAEGHASEGSCSAGGPTRRTVAALDADADREATAACVVRIAAESPADGRFHENDSAREPELAHVELGAHPPALPGVPELF